MSDYTSIAEKNWNEKQHEYRLKRSQEDKENNNIFRGYGVEVSLPDKQSFLKIMETLTRIGIASATSKVLTQSCHVLHKRGRYAILHFKEMFALDGKPTTFTQEDKERRNKIVTLLSDWELLDIVELVPKDYSSHNLTIIRAADKSEWQLRSKYQVGK